MLIDLKQKFEGKDPLQPLLIQENAIHTSQVMKILLKALATLTETFMQVSSRERSSAYTRLNLLVQMMIISNFLHRITEYFTFIRVFKSNSLFIKINNKSIKENLSI